MKSVELTSLSERELVVKEYDVKRELANVKFRHALGQLEKNSDIKDLRRVLARLKTEVRRREIEAGLPKDELYRRHASTLRASNDVESGETSTSSGTGGGLFASLRRRLTGESESA